MADGDKFNFYGRMRIDKVWLTYRRLAVALVENRTPREEAFAVALEELSGSDPDLRRIKFLPPPFLTKLLTPAEQDRLEAVMAPGRRRAARLKMVYPVSADEFSLDPDFLRLTLDFSRGPAVASGGRFFTVGSCFAVSIADYLSGHGHDADCFQLAEDLNSPMSNAFLFDILRRPLEARLEPMARGVGAIFPQMDAASCRGVAEFKLPAINELAAELARADCVVMTLGNIIDFFRDDADPGLPLVERLFPKYLAMAVEGDQDGNDNAAQRLKARGATLRMATHAETCEAIRGCVAGIRAITKAPIVITLSPVPLDAAVGLAKTELRSAVEVDCVSKSRLRSALEEISLGLQADCGPIHYFPSYELVRWLAPMQPFPAFGKEDGCSRHVSADILQAVCTRFVDDFVQWTEPRGAAAQGQAGEGAPCKP
jgi:hypothetical protein